jgi:hypothetical protein
MVDTTLGETRVTSGQFQLRDSSTHHPPRWAEMRHSACSELGYCNLALTMGSVNLAGIPHVAIKESRGPVGRIGAEHIARPSSRDTSASTDMSVSPVGSSRSPPNRHEMPTTYMASSQAALALIPPLARLTSASGRSRKCAEPCRGRPRAAFEQDRTQKANCVQVCAVHTRHLTKSPVSAQLVRALREPRQPWRGLASTHEICEQDNPPTAHDLKRKHVAKA